MIAKLEPFVVIRDMELADIPTIVQLGTGQSGFTVSDTDPASFWTNEQLKEWIENKNRDILLVATCDDEIIGFILVNVLPQNVAWWQNDFALVGHPQATQATLKLHQELKRRLQSIHILRCDWIAGVDNRRANVFYKRIAQKGKKYRWFYWLLAQQNE